MKSRIFISSVQREFAKERKNLASYIRQDAILGKFFDVFLFEEVPAQERKEMTLAKMYKRHKSYPANPLLAYAMFLRKYIEQTGTGTGDIIARCQEWGLPDPKWQVEDGDDFVMVMPRPQSPAETSVRTVDWTVDWTVDKTADGSTNERILNLLATNPRATQEELARVLGLSVRGIEYAIGTLKKINRIRKVGGKRFGHWEVIG